jgi:hypothetical protein
MKTVYKSGFSQLLSAASILWAATVPAAIAELEIIPGKSLGMIDTSSTESEIRTQLGESNVRRIIHSAGEGEYQCATEVFPDSKYSAVIIWEGSNGDFNEDVGGGSLERCIALPPFKQMQYLDLSSGPNWRLEGIGSGMTLYDLESVNEAPVTFHSCECCADGGIADWNGGKFTGAAYLDAYGQSLLGMTLRYSEIDSEVKARRDDIGNVKSSDLPNDIKRKVRIENFVVRVPSKNETD